MPKSTELSAADDTLDASPREESGLAPSGEASAWRPRRGPVALVEGSGLELTAETEDLLRRRLRLAAVILSGGFASFLPVHYFAPQEPFGWSLFALHAAVAGVLGLVAVMLCRQCAIPLGRLRTVELVVFMLPLAFLLALQHRLTGTCCQEGYFRFPAHSWLMLIFTYALFIPNTLRRAAVVIGVIAATPLAMLFWMLWRDPALAAMTGVGDIAGLILMLLMASVAGVFGVDTIGSLRREAFEARQLGHYRLKERIGVGGMGEVYLAEHQLLKRPCVIKLIRPDKAGNPKVLARFQREVQATAKLTHWNTIEIFDYGVTDDGTFYYVMEYLPGMSLGELVERSGPLPPERVIYLLRQACDALSEAHEAGLVHRDIKPANIFAAQRGGVYDVVKLLDFGLVKPILSGEPSVELTADGAITGSPLFMSPEQAVGETKPCPLSDIYSLGAVGYFLLTGRPPFVASKPIKVMIAHAHQEVAPPSQHRPDVPADLEQVILRCLAKDARDRYASAASLAQALSECAAAEGWNPQRAAQWWQQQEQRQEQHQAAAAISAVP